jgi:tRNA threonylcarbamoyladenosine biosynthesis protein TsaB
LFENGVVVEELLLHSPQSYAQILYGELKAMLDRHGWSLESIDCFASAAGPGSFTGVRVGLAAVKGFGEALGKPVIAVSNLEALAASGSKPLRAAILDARRGDIYCGLFDEHLNVIVPEHVTKPQAFFDALPAGDIEFLTKKGMRFEHAPVTEIESALAGTIAKIAAARFEAGAVTDPAAIDANYVRRCDAEMLWTDSR